MSCEYPTNRGDTQLQSTLDAEDYGCEYPTNRGDTQQTSLT